MVGAGRLNQIRAGCVPLLDRTVGDRIYRLSMRNEDNIMSITLKGSLAGLALVAALAAAGCSSSSSPSHPAKPHHAAQTSSGSKIPQNNGGDHDTDNNGGPSDGDGNL